jgi:hypothetical protein
MRANRRITFDGKTPLLSEWAAITGIHYMILHYHRWFALLKGVHASIP